MKFEDYVTKVEQLIIDYTKELGGDELGQIHESIEESDAGCGKIWLEDFVDDIINRGK
jgi:hypothetical protein